jgi:hypothetical protein
MKGLLKLLGSECWGRHDWIYKANSRGLWLECRRCGHESPGLELPAPSYRRTQQGIEDAHKLSARQPAPVAPAQGPTAAWRFVERRAGLRPPFVTRSSARETAAASTPSMGADEQRWIELWRSLSPEARAVADRMMASLATRDAALRARDAGSIAHAS